jgi:histone acetyltransferase (RNA polymerase elongator complex component)
MELIATFPVSTVEIGVQSMNDSILALARRGHRSTDTRSAVALLKQADYTIGLQLMVGLPGEILENLLESTRQIAALRPDFVRIYPTLVIKGSPLARWYQAGKYTPLSLSQAVEHTKKLFLIFHQKKIRVIRMGLQASKELSQGDTVLAGPYHPAFGHMVYASIFLDAMRRMLLQGSPSLDGSVRISTSPKDISKAQGLNNQNLQLLKKEFKLDHLKIIADPALPSNTLSMENKEPIPVFLGHGKK